MLNSQSVLRNDVTPYCLARWVWDLFWVEFVFFFIVLAPGLQASQYSSNYHLSRKHRKVWITFHVLISLQLICTVTRTVLNHWFASFNRWQKYKKLLIYKILMFIFNIIHLTGNKFRNTRPLLAMHSRRRNFLKTEESQEFPKTDQLTSRQSDCRFSMWTQPDSGRRVECYGPPTQWIVQYVRLIYPWF